MIAFFEGALFSLMLHHHHHLAARSPSRRLRVLSVGLEGAGNLTNTSGVHAHVLVLKKRNVMVLMATELNILFNS